ncbi:MAG: hypothetical protein CMM30_09785 [Rhodospirillaceae bacterium]|nr:hypothetical protein [Alphaproteobacteria bacterium]MBR73212.1 hypothetical protein [Rhodospirillaceae bacterium]|tara:strand:- start:11659 stop:12417 length:759 start_codon:yes stop_codon:yes gene_type:complete
MVKLKQLNLQPTFGFLIAIIICLYSGISNAETNLSNAKELFHQGKWKEAVELSKNDESGEGYALAAQITCYYGRFLAAEENKEELFSQAMALAEKGAKMSPESPFAHLQVAHAMGRYSQTVGILEALAEGFADRILESVNKAIELDPNYATAYLLLGNWHAEIINSAGFMGRMIYGASESESITAYDKAIKLEPNNLLIKLEYAGGLLKLDEDSYYKLAIAQLKTVISKSPNNTFDKILQTKAKQMLSALTN